MAKKILVVDDEKDIVRVLEAILTSNGYDVITAYDGKDGLKKAKEGRPDLIVLDILMPEVDGVAMGAALRSDADLKDTPIIFLTCLVEKDEVKDKGHIIAGAVFLAKPFEKNEILSTIKKILK